jgi:hypothetical protein
MGERLDSRLINTANQQKQSLPFGLLVFWFFGFFSKKSNNNNNPGRNPPTKKYFE